MQFDVAGKKSSFGEFADVVIQGSRMIPTFLTVADGNIEIASRSKLETSVLSFIWDGGPVIHISVLLKFKLRKLECSQSFKLLTHEDKEAIEWVESGWQAVYI